MNFVNRSRSSHKEIKSNYSSGRALSGRTSETLFVGLPGGGETNPKGGHLSDVAENVEDGGLRVVGDLFQCQWLPVA